MQQAAIPESHTIEDPEKMWVISSPTRRGILRAACALGTCSVGEIAEMTGRSRTSLYPHIEQLVERELLIESGTRPSGKRQEQLYQPIARHIKTRHDSEKPEVVKFHIAYGKAVCRHVARLFEHAITRRDSKTRGPERDTLCSSQTVWVNQSELEEINNLIDRLHKLCSRNEPGQNKRLIQISMLMAPEARAVEAGLDTDTDTDTDAADIATGG